MRTLFSLLFILTLPILLTGQNATKTSKSAEQLIETIIEKTGAEKVPNTVDVIKEGNADTKIKGIVTCMFATMDVLRKAVEKNCNLIITHEPLYYNHLDSSEQFESDAVYLEKKKFIEENNLVVWRFHDYIHRIQPDGIISGMVEKLDWADYQSKDNAYKFTFPPISLIDFLKGMKEAFPENGFHVVGDSTIQVSNVVFAPGSSGAMIQIGQLRLPDVDIVVAGEVPQWETYEYVRDAIAQGRKMAIVFIGHINSEENGMKFCADWLREFVTEIPIHFIECGSSYWTY